MKNNTPPFLNPTTGTSNGGHEPLGVKAKVGGGGEEPLLAFDQGFYEHY